MRQKHKGVVQAPQLNPVVTGAGLVRCVGGPANGKRMQNPVGYRLFIINAVDGLRAVSMPPEHLDLCKRLGGYAGHYDPGDDVLVWVAPDGAA